MEVAVQLGCAIEAREAMLLAKSTVEEKKTSGEKTSPEHKLSVQSWCSFFCNAAYSSTLHKSSLNLSLTCGQAHGSSPVLGWGSFRTKKVPSFWFSWPGGTVLLGSSFTDEPDERGLVTAATAHVALPTYVFCHRPWKEYVIGVNICCRVTVVLQRLFGKPRLEDHLPSALTLSTGKFLSRCQGKPQAVLENGRETSLQLQQWVEWDYRAWSVPLWKSNKCTP